MGKIATDQHLPAIEANPRFKLAATVERSAPTSAINFTSHDALLAAADRLDAVAITTPPGPRYDIARDCIEAGLHVLLEKPPTASLAEIDDLRERASARNLSLFTTWHAQHNPAVAAAAELLAGRRIRAMTITWHEDVEKWHPGQRGIWEAGGFGVFDPGINAFSIVSRIFPASLFVRTAALHFPRASHTPIAAEIEFASPASEGPLRCSLDWRRSAGRNGRSTLRRKTDWRLSCSTAARDWWSTARPSRPMALANIPISTAASPSWSSAARARSTRFRFSWWPTACWWAAVTSSKRTSGELGSCAVLDAGHSTDLRLPRAASRRSIRSGRSTTLGGY